jgi:hypothetical protein
MVPRPRVAARMEPEEAARGVTGGRPKGARPVGRGTSRTGCHLARHLPMPAEGDLFSCLKFLDKIIKVYAIPLEVDIKNKVFLLWDIPKINRIIDDEIQLCLLRS